MKRITIIFAAFLLLSIPARAQAPIETIEGATVLHTITELVRFDSADSTIFRIDGVGDIERSGVMYAWGNMGLWLKATGDSVKVRVYIYAGQCELLTTTLADTTSYNFALVDSVDIETSGLSHRQISNYMPSCDHWYIALKGLTGNGSDTYFGEGVAIKERY